MEIPTPVCALVRNDNVVRRPGFPLQIPICVPQNDTERVRVGTITDHARHDLAVGPADKFPICLFTVENQNCKLFLKVLAYGKTAW